MATHPETSQSKEIILPRFEYLQVLQAANTAGEFRYAREAALSWLAAFPGDLQAGLYYAQALAGEERTKQALAVLVGLCEADAEFTEANLARLQMEIHLQAQNLADTIASILALQGKLKDQETVATWGRTLWMSRLALQQGDIPKAEDFIHQVLANEPPTPLAAITHLKILKATEGASLSARRNLASFYHKQWPANLQCSLLLADCLMESGEADQAVALLHQAAARDVGGQVATRLWGEQHPYRSIWPEGLEMRLPGVLPVRVAALLGWNRLAPGTLETGIPSLSKNKSQPNQKSAQLTPNTPPPPITGDTRPIEIPQGVGKNGRQETESPGKEALLPIQEELERVAKNLNQPELAKLDARFPVYVVLSIRQALELHYGHQAAASVLEAMQQLVKSVQARPGWGARIFLADDPACTGEMQISPARPNDPWGIKLAMADFDAVLAKRGERIGALLIVGGPEIVPYHLLPNPVDDEDLDVPSDNPYATRDENYFVPEWPVGRLPGGAGKNPQLLLRQIDGASLRHAAQQLPVAWYQDWWRRLIGWLRPHLGSSRDSYAFTAAVWRKASLAVFQPIREGNEMLVSPPVMIDVSGNHTQSIQPRPGTRLGYFNLHGLVDACEWYGQRDPVESANLPDYPLALRPQDIDASMNSGQPFQVVFTESCYGAHILGKTAQDSMALKFLESGSQAVVGSTTMAYGSISTPLTAADLLGQAFWKYIHDGFSAGEALQRAKLHLAHEMSTRQGYLDGEDQKTLISFVLYGDPLAAPFARATSAKRVERPAGRPFKPFTVKTICDRTETTEQGQGVPPAVSDYVRHVVAQYLPGMEDANLAYSHERSDCQSAGHVCPTHQLHSKSGHPERRPERSLVILSKQVARSEHIHTHYARLTLDGQGKLVKLVVSR